MSLHVRSAISAAIPHRGWIAASLLFFATAGHAATIVIDYDGATEGDFFTSPHLEDGTTTTVDSGHYDIFADPTGGPGDLALNLDEQFGGLAQITITVDGGLLFDAISLDVINAADSAGEYTITAIGNSGSVSAPTVGGVFVFGPGFESISALVITQNSGFFTIDDLTLEAVPEPGTAALLSLGLVGIAARRREGLR